jgi:hypothetical protein
MPGFHWASKEPSHERKSVSAKTCLGALIRIHLLHSSKAIVVMPSDEDDIGPGQDSHPPGKLSSKPEILSN